MGYRYQFRSSVVVGCWQRSVGKSQGKDVDGYPMGYASLGRLPDKEQDVLASGETRWYTQHLWLYPVLWSVCQNEDRGL